MDVADATQALYEVTGTPARSVQPIHGGWASYTFKVDGRYIARFPRNASVARCTQAELELLPRLAPLVAFAVPQVRWQGTRTGFPFFVYESIPGRPLTVPHFDAHPGLAPALASALGQLHRTDLSLTATASGGPGGRPGAAPGPGGTWRARHTELRTRAAAQVAPLLDRPTARLFEAAWDEFEAASEFTPALVHADLGLEHVLVSGDGLSGIIDWETAGPGDPAVDFVGFHIGLGPERTRRILDRYDPTDPQLCSRIPHYVWMGAVHAVLYGLDADRPDIVGDGLQGLGERLRALD